MCLTAIDNDVMNEKPISNALIFSKHSKTKIIHRDRPMTMRAFQRCAKKKMLLFIIVDADWVLLILFSFLFGDDEEKPIGGRWGDGQSERFSSSSQSQLNSRFSWFSFLFGCCCFFLFFSLPWRRRLGIHFGCWNPVIYLILLTQFNWDLLTSITWGIYRWTEKKNNKRTEGDFHK